MPKRGIRFPRECGRGVMRMVRRRVTARGPRLRLAASSQGIGLKLQAVLTVGDPEAGRDGRLARDIVQGLSLVPNQSSDYIPRDALQADLKCGLNRGLPKSASRKNASKSDT